MPSTDLSEILSSVPAFAIYKKKQQPKRPVKKSKKKKEIIQQNGNNGLNKRKKLIKRKHSIKDNEKNDDDDEVPTLIEVNTMEVEEQNEIMDTNGIEEETRDEETVVNVKKPKKVKTTQLQGNLEENEEDYNGNEDVVDDPQTEALKLFKWLIAPIEVSEFLNKYWEKCPLHIIRKKERYYTHILNSKTLDNMLREYPLQYTKNIDVVSYENGVKNIYNQEGRAVPTAIWDYYSNGCSIRILNPQTYNKKIHLLLATLQEYFGTMVGANVYLTPPNSQGFAPHYDDIEAFVIQLEGRKYWKLYQPSGSDVLARYSSPNFNREQLGEPFMEVVLEAGDLLYFPRGVIHEGCTDKDSHSLHITVSVYQNTAYIDLLEKVVPQVLKQAAEKSLAFRKGLPLNYLKFLGSTSQQSTKKSRVVDAIEKMIKILPKYLEPKHIDQAVDQMGRKFIYDSMPPVPTKSEIKRCSKGDGDYLENGKVLNRIEITLDTKIRLFRYYCLQLTNEDGIVKLYYNTENANFYHGEEEQWLELDPKMITIIRYLQNSYPQYVKIGKIPVDDDIKLAAISDFWERGLIVTSKSIDTFDD